MKNNKVTKPMKLLTYLKEERNFSQDKAEKLLKNGRVLVNGDVCTSPDLMLKKDDEVKIKKNKKLIAGAAIPLTALTVAGAIGGAASVIPVVNNSLMVINVACANGTTWKDGSTTTKQIKVKKDSTLGDNRSALSEFEISSENGVIAWTDSPDPKTSLDLNSYTVLEENQTIYATAGVEINYSAGIGRIVSGSTVETARVGQTFGQISKPEVAGPTEDDFFDGWVDENGQPILDRTAITSNLNVTAKFISQRIGDYWFITFTTEGLTGVHLVGNTYVPIDKGKELYTVNKPFAYKEGYKLIGWEQKLGEDNWADITEEAKVTSNITLRPKMAEASETKTATFKRNNPQAILVQGSETVEFKAGIKFKELPTPTYELAGSIFHHWASNESGTLIDPDTVLTDDLNVYASWEQITALTATFVAGDIPETATVTWDGPTQVGYEQGSTFGGINKPHPTVVTTSGTAYKVKGYSLKGQPLTDASPLPNVSCTIVVEFEPDETRHTLTYYANGGEFPEGEITSIEFNDGDTFGNYHQPNVTYEGNVFAGWFTSQEGTTQFTSDTVLDRNTTKAYAHWTPAAVAHTITFTKQAVNLEGTVLGDAILEGPTEFGFTETIPWTDVTTPIAWYFPSEITTVYMFDHFQYSVNGGTTWDDVSDELVLDQDTLIRPVFGSSTQYITIGYNPNDGTAIIEYKNVPVESKFGDLIKPTPVREGYIFQGWFDKAGSDGNPIEDDTVFTVSTVIFAHWEEAPTVKQLTFYSDDPSVTFHGNTDVAFEPGETGKAFGDINVPLPEKTGYIFDGWYIGSSTEHDPGTEVTLDTIFTDNATIYPKFVNPYVKANRYFHQDGDGNWWVYDTETLCTLDESTAIVRTCISDPTKAPVSTSRSTFNEAIYVGEDLYAIADNFLHGCTAFNKTITFTEDCTIRSIGTGFMAGCSAFNQPIDMSNCANLEYIDDNFLENCTSFNKHITFSSATTELGVGFLYGCTSFNNGCTDPMDPQPWTLPETIKIIDAQFLMDCTSYDQDLTLPASIESIGEFFMNNCDSFISGYVNVSNIPASRINQVFKGLEGTFSTSKSSAEVVTSGFGIYCPDEATWNVLFQRFPHLTGPLFWRTMERRVD